MVNFLGTKVRSGRAVSRKNRAPHRRNARRWLKVLMPTTETPDLPSETSRFRGQFSAGDFFGRIRDGQAH
ncbi:protein of unknown function [Thiomonas sp. Bio17B3]|nr:protein of unknown function [Thiomonas sp. Bio17B3]VDY14424.1 protein of unknown function [Thiomonas sp. OC7]